MAFRGRDSEGFELEAPTFTRKVVHEDGHSETASVVTYTNDEANYKGSLSFPRRLSRQTGNFDKGTASLHTKGVDGRDFVAFVPLEGWINYLGDDPKAVADKIEGAAEKLLARWKTRNLPLVGDARKPLSWADEICRYEWKGANRKELSVFEVQLNTYSLTNAHQYERRPQVTADEVKLLIKTRSSVNVESRPDKSNVDHEGLAQDNRGYNKELYHFLGYLRSDECARQLAEVREDIAGLKKKTRGGGGGGGEEERLSE